MKKPVAWSIATVAVLLLCPLSYFFADLEAAVWFHRFAESGLYDLFNKITRFGESQWYLVAGLLLFVVFRKSKPVSAASGALLFSSVAVSGLSADIIKFLAGRARPKLYFSEQIYGFDFLHTEHAWTSFPSGHSATAFSVAMTLAILYPRLRPLFFIAGSLVAFSRVFLAQHYISDIIAGSFLGIASTLLLHNLYFKRKVETSEPEKI